MTRPARPAPLSLRLTPEDRARLERDAAGMSLGSYIRWRVFDPASPPPKSRGKAPVKDHQALSAVLGKFGQSRIANNLNQLAREANSGSLALTPDVDALIREAAAEVSAIRALLMTSLGLAHEDPKCRDSIAGDVSVVRDRLADALRTDGDAP